MVMIADRYLNLTTIVLMRGMRARDIAQAFITLWVSNSVRQFWLLSDNAKQFAATLFTYLCRMIRTTSLFTSIYRRQASGQPERFNRMMPISRSHYVMDQPNDGGLFRELITYGYNCNIHSTTNAIPLELMFSKTPGDRGSRQQMAVRG